MRPILLKNDLLLAIAVNIDNTIQILIYTGGLYVEVQYHEQYTNG